MDDKIIIIGSGFIGSDFNKDEWSKQLEKFASEVACSLKEIENSIPQLLKLDEKTINDLAMAGLSACEAGEALKELFLNNETGDGEFEDNAFLNLGICEDFLNKFYRILFRKEYSLPFRQRSKIRFKKIFNHRQPKPLLIRKMKMGKSQREKRRLRITKKRTKQ